MPPEPPTPVEAALSDLEEESLQRERVLVELADQLPNAVSRTALISALLRDLGGMVLGRRRL